MGRGTDESNGDRAEGFAPDEIEGIREGLLDWYDRHRRDLPWRGIDDPYKTWVAEIMLQQTRVETVLDYYESWMRRFPDVESVAAADVDEVLDLWEGLGYYRRARFLHRSARRVVEEYDGSLPETAEELEELTGIGPYTAGAIASIAFDQPVPVVDGNVSRVLSRLRAIAGDPTSTENKKRYWELAEVLVDPDRPGDFNQAVMELGATVCTPQAPNCLLCPLRDCCEAFEAGEPESYPDKASRATQKPVDVVTCVLAAEFDGDLHCYVSKRDPEGLLGGLWEFPTVELADDVAAERQIEKRLADVFGSELAEGFEGEAIAEITHLFSHLRMTIDIRFGRVGAEPLEPRQGIEPLEEEGRGWLPLENLDTIAMSTAMRRVERQIREHLSGFSPRS